MKQRREVFIEKGIKCINAGIKRSSRSLYLNGGMTIEAALVLPVFIFTILSVAYFMVILNYQNILQNSINDTAESVGRYAYVLERVENISDEVLSSSTNWDKELLASGINTAYVWKKMMTEEVKGYSEKVNVVGGTKGILITDSKIDQDGEGINDIKVQYRIAIPIFGENTYQIQLSNRCYFREWIGTSIDNRSLDIDEDRIVFITNTGTVYHLTDTCTYINLDVKQVRYEEVAELRNEAGAKYKSCKSCVTGKLKADDIVFVTEDGTRFHSNRVCSKITRTVIKIKKAEVGERTLCSRCKEKMEQK